MSRLWQPGRRHNSARPSGRRNCEKNIRKRSARPRLEALEDRTLLSVDLSDALFLPVEPSEMALLNSAAPLEPTEVPAEEAVTFPTPGDLSAEIPEVPAPVLIDPVPTAAELPALTLRSNGPVAEGGSAQVTFVPAAEVPAEVLAGLTFSYDFNGDGVFEIENSNLTTVAVPAEFLSDGPATLEVHARVTDAAGNSADYMTTLEVQNVPPTLEVETPGVIDEGGTVTLDLGAEDPGADEVESWVIDWGDGSQENVPGDSPPVTHVFPEGPSTFTIQVRAADDDGAYQAPPLQVFSNLPRVAESTSAQPGIVPPPVAVTANLRLTSLVNLASGYTTVSFTQTEAPALADLSPISPKEFRILPAGGSTMQVSSGTNATAVIAGRVYRDDNRNGRLDSGEPGQADREVVLEVPQASGWQIVRRTRTKADGSYSFDSLSLGRYRVRPVLPAEQALTSAAQEGREVSVTGAGETIQVDFGVARKMALPSGEPDARLSLPAMRMRQEYLADWAFQNWQAANLLTEIPQEMVALPEASTAEVVFEEDWACQSQSGTRAEHPSVGDTLAGAGGMAVGLTFLMQATHPTAGDNPTSVPTVPSRAGAEAPPRRGWFARLWDRLFGGNHS